MDTIRKTGLEQALSTALSRWGRPTAIHDPAKILCDLAITLVLGGDCLARDQAPTTTPPPTTR